MLLVYTFSKIPLAYYFLPESQTLIIQLVLKLVKVMYNAWMMGERFQECLLVI